MGRAELTDEKSRSRSAAVSQVGSGALCGPFVSTSCQQNLGLLAQYRLPAVQTTGLANRILIFFWNNTLASKKHAISRRINATYF